MAKFEDLDVTGWSPKRLVDYINVQIADHASVEIFKRAGKVILRTWF